MIHLFRGTNPIIVSFLMTGLGCTADFFIKTAAVSENAWMLGIGAILYATTAIGWYQVLSSTTLATVAVWYSVMIILLLTAMGYFVFNEAITLKRRRPLCQAAGQPRSGGPADPGRLGADSWWRGPESHLKLKATFFTGMAVTPLPVTDSCHE